MDSKTLAAGLAGFLLGGFVVSVAATLEEGDDSSDHGSQSVTVETLRR